MSNEVSMKLWIAENRMTKQAWAAKDEVSEHRSQWLSCVASANVLHRALDSMYKKCVVNENMSYTDEQFIGEVRKHADKQVADIKHEVERWIKGNASMGAYATAWAEAVMNGINVEIELTKEEMKAAAHLAAVRVAKENALLGKVWELTQGEGYGSVEFYLGLWLNQVLYYFGQVNADAYVGVPGTVWRTFSDTHVITVMTLAASVGYDRWECDPSMSRLPEFLPSVKVWMDDNIETAPLDEVRLRVLCGNTLVGLWDRVEMLWWDGMDYN